MIRNKMFSLFCIKIFVMLLFLSNVPFLLFADTNNNPNDDKRYTYQSDYQSRPYTRKSHYPAYCGDNNKDGDDWTTYPSSTLDTGLSDYPTCLKKRYCSDLDEDGKLYITTPDYNENNEQTLNCYKKSCLDLTTAELRAIYNNQKISNHYYKFCEPVKYSNLQVGNRTITVRPGGSSEAEPVYCNEFTKEELEYLVPNIQYRTGINNEQVHQCLLHQCPLSSDVSALCKTNFWMFSDKSGNQRIRSDDYITRYEEKILGNANAGINERYNSCTQLDEQGTIGCQKNRSSRLLSCDGELNTSCDEYIGFDRKFGTQYDNLKNSFSSYNGTTQTCSEDGTCRQTIDCHLAENASYYSCNINTGSAGSSDVFLSYFYRPYPHPATTEILNVDKSWLSNSNDGKTLSTKIYDKSFNIPETPNSKITVIKRLMRGGTPKPLPSDNPNMNGYISETRNKTQLDVHLTSLISNSKNKNYFNYINRTTNYTTNRLNICMSSEDDFKEYGFRKITLYSGGDGSWFEGEYYRANISRIWAWLFGPQRGDFEIFNDPHLIPLCDENTTNTTYSSYGYTGALCVIEPYNNNSECSTPRSDSYYIKGKPIFEYKTDAPELKEVRVNACLRKRNQYGSCGERECKVSAKNCDTSGCSELKQTCSEDTCVVLIWKNELDCNLSNNYENDCIKKIPNSQARFRLQKINNKMYVFIDDDSGMTLNGATRNRWSNCPNSSDMKKRKSNINKVETTYLDTYQKGGKNASIITYRGRITNANLLDSNDLIDYNGDGKIDDRDVFGEELYEIFKCGNQEERNIEKCTSMSTENKENGAHNWITWDIVQYIGNNQPTENNPNCKVGNLKNCRGYYDAEGKFHKEQQGIPIPLPASQKFFYKYATLNNSSNMFLPLLRIISAKSYDNDFVDIKNTEDDNNIRLNFFEPTVRIGFGKKETDNIAIPFNEMSVSNEIEDNSRNIEIKIKYKLKKTVDGIQEPSGSVCLSRIIKENEGTQTEDIEEVVKCLKRKNPTIDSIIIKTPQASTREDGPYMNASFIKKELVNKIDNSSITLDDNNSIKFLSRNTIENNNNMLEKLKPNTYGEAQKYPIYIERSRCSSLQYECMAYRSDLIDEKNNLEKINKKIELEGLESNNNKTEQRILKAKIADLNKKIDNCEDTQKYCDNLNNGTFLVSKITFADNVDGNILNNYRDMRLCRLYKTGKSKYSNYSNYCTDSVENLIENEDKEENILSSTIETALKNYNLVGSTNDICISSGFSEYFPNVVAHPSVGDTLGKCVLTAESKAKQECRRGGFYSFCTDNSDFGCKCVNGLSDCDCSDGISCVKYTYCNVDNENSTDLPEECFLPGFNYYKTVLKAGNTLDISCQCELATSNSNTSGKEIRKATPRELGLCANLRTVPFCQAVKYYDENKVYNDGGAGEKLDVIKNKYKSNIWRTNQTKLGKYKIKSFDANGTTYWIGNLKHAEFDLTRYYNGQDQYNTQKLYCYNKDSGHNYIFDNTVGCEGGGYEPVIGTTGECNGFWKNKVIKITNSQNKTSIETIKPLAYCHDAGHFNLYQNTGCERYSCPVINENNPNYATDNEKSQINNSEIDYLTANRKGLSHGFANWGSYKKGTYDITSETIRDDEVENGHGDDIEQRTAESCIQGYAPAGFGKILYKYFPVAFNARDEISQEFDKDNFIENMLLNNDDFILKDSMSNKLSYNAKMHLPIRYCNQIGQWMPVEDIYTRFKIEPYSISNQIFHDKLTSSGYVDVGLYGKRGVPIEENNTYGINVDYSQKYCERLFCKGILYNDIVQSIDREEADIGEEEKLNEYPLKINGIYDKNGKINYFDNNEVNKFTYWRHTGGATWNETPAPLEDESITIKGSCSSLAGYFPKDAVFLFEDKVEIAENSDHTFKTRYSSFAKQHADLFSNFSGDERNPKVFDFVFNRQDTTKPTRQCDKWGIWGEIENKCEKACDPIDPFRTKFSADSTGKLQIQALYKIPHLRSDYYEHRSNNKYGDKYTGGAQWGRTLAGQYAIGECDSTISKDINVFDKNSIQKSSKNIVFIRSGSPETKVNGISTGGRPYRQCLPDGTWGNVEDPCILYEACPEKTIINMNLTDSSNVETKQTVGILNSSSLTIDKINETTGQEKIIEIKSLCDSRYYTGEITGQCSLGNKDWKGDITSTCKLKTCSGFKKALGKNGSITFFDVSDNKYFAKGSGFKNNKLSMKNESYLGYKAEKQCPSYFTCKDCEKNAVSYTCDYDQTENKLGWTVNGSCEPVSCSVENLEKVCNVKAGCELSSKLEEPNESFITDEDKSFKEITKNVAFEESDSKYDEINRRYAIGSLIKLDEGRKYKYKGGNEVYAICKEENNGNGIWITRGSFESLKCADSDLSIIDNASWITTNVGVCEDGSNSNGLSCPETEKLLQCNDGYERAPDAEKLSAQCLYMNDGREVSWSNVNLNEEIVSRYCIKKSDI